VDEIDGTESPYYREPKVCLTNAKNYGPREEKRAGAKGK
jgi:hypothetical protein